MQIIGKIFEFVGELGWSLILIVAWLAFWPILLPIAIIRWIIRSAVASALREQEERRVAVK